MKTTIIQNFYARLFRNDQTMLDTSCDGSFMKKTIEFQWDLLESLLIDVCFLVYVMHLLPFKDV